MRRVFKVLLWVVLGPVLLVLLIALAWVACNNRWADADPQPVPPELLPQPVTLAPQDNAFFDAQGLNAPEGESPNAWGQRVWRNDVDQGAKQVTVPTGYGWNCDSGNTDCLARWRASSAALTAQMVAARTFGERCKALAARTAYQEVLPVQLGKRPDQVTLPHFMPASTCLRWLQMEAVLAPDAQRAQAAWAQADALNRLFASGAQTLIGQAVAWSWTMRHQLLLAQWSAQQPAGTVLPAAWLAPLPARLLQPRTWMAAESHWQREATAGLTGEQMFGMEPNALQAWAGRHSLGYMPERTVQASSAYWLADMRLFGDLQGPALVHAVQSRPEVPVSWWHSIYWRNTMGQILVEVARPQYQTYALRQADLLLQQAALGLSQQLNAVPAAERAAWWARQPLDAGLRERLSLDGDAVLVRTWRGERDPAYEVPVRFPLRPA